MDIYRQGDLGFIPIDALPQSAVKSKSRLLRRGEHGGLHQLDREPAAEIYVLEGKKFILAKDGALVIHGEHGAVSLPAGLYEVRVQRELMDSRELRVVD